MAAHREVVQQLLADLALESNQDDVCVHEYAALYTEENTAALVGLMRADPIAFDTTIKKIAGVTEISIGALRDHVARAAKASLESVKTEAEPETYPDEVKATGDVTLQEGDVLGFLLEQFHKNHVGDDMAGRELFISFATGSSLTADGLQPGTSGDAQIGKTHAMRSAVHCMPKHWVICTGLSDKAAYYLDLKPGVVVFSDDIIWRDGLVYMLKESMSMFQTGTTWTTVMKIDGELQAAPKEIPPRVLWWLTSADGAINDQIETRQYPLYVDVSLPHAQAVSDGISKRRQNGRVEFATDQDILIARYILDKLRDDGPFKVHIPYADRVDYKMVRDYRGKNQFYDLIEGLAILNYQQREVRDGCIIATIEDFKEASRIFNSKTEAHVTGLAKGELDILKAMTEKERWTQAELTKKLDKSVSTISRRLNAIMQKTAYITKVRSWSGEDFYQLTDKFNFGVLDGDIVTLRD